MRSPSPPPLWLLSLTAAAVAVVVAVLAPTELARAQVPVTGVSEIQVSEVQATAARLAWQVSPLAARAIADSNVASGHVIVAQRLYAAGNGASVRPVDDGDDVEYDDDGDGGNGTRSLHAAMHALVGDDDDDDDDDDENNADDGGALGQDAVLPFRQVTNVRGLGNATTTVVYDLLPGYTYLVRMSVSLGKFLFSMGTTNVTVTTVDEPQLVFSSSGSTIMLYKNSSMPSFRSLSSAATQVHDRERAEAGMGQFQLYPGLVGVDECNLTSFVTPSPEQLFGPGYGCRVRDPHSVAIALGRCCASIRPDTYTGDDDIPEVSVHGVVATVRSAYDPSTLKPRANGPSTVSPCSEILVDGTASSGPQAEAFPLRYNWKVTQVPQNELRRRIPLPISPADARRPLLRVNASRVAQGTFLDFTLTVAVDDVYAATNGAGIDIAASRTSVHRVFITSYPSTDVVLTGSIHSPIPVYARSELNGHAFDPPLPCASLHVEAEASDADDEFVDAINADGLQWTITQGTLRPEDTSVSATGSVLRIDPLTVPQSSVTGLRVAEQSSSRVTILSYAQAVLVSRPAHAVVAVSDGTDREILCPSHGPVVVNASYSYNVASCRAAQGGLCDTRLEIDCYLYPGGFPCNISSGLNDSSLSHILDDDVLFGDDGGADDSDDASSAAANITEEYSTTYVLHDRGVAYIDACSLFAKARNLSANPADASRVSGLDSRNVYIMLVLTERPDIYAYTDFGLCSESVILRPVNSSLPNVTFTANVSRIAEGSSGDFHSPLSQSTAQALVHLHPNAASAPKFDPYPGLNRQTRPSLLVQPTNDTSSGAAMQAPVAYTRVALVDGCGAAVVDVWSRFGVVTLDNIPFFQEMQTYTMRFASWYFTPVTQANNDSDKGTSTAGGSDGQQLEYVAQASAWASVTVIVNTPPLIGGLLRDPARGIAVGTQFVLSGLQVSDAEVDLPIRMVYEVALLINSSAFLSSAEQRFKHAEPLIFPSDAEWYYLDKTPECCSLRLAALPYDATHVGIRDPANDDVSQLPYNVSWRVTALDFMGAVSEPKTTTGNYSHAQVAVVPFEQPGTAEDAAQRLVAGLSEVDTHEWFRPGMLTSAMLTLESYFFVGAISPSETVSAGVHLAQIVLAVTVDYDPWDLHAGVTNAFLLARIVHDVTVTLSGRGELLPDSERKDVCYTIAAAQQAAAIVLEANLNDDGTRDELPMTKTDCQRVLNIAQVAFEQRYRCPGGWALRAVTLTAAVLGSECGSPALVSPNVLSPDSPEQFIKLFNLSVGCSVAASLYRSPTDFSFTVPWYIPHAGDDKCDYIPRRYIGGAALFPGSNGDAESSSSSSSASSSSVASAALATDTTTAARRPSFLLSQQKLSDDGNFPMSVELPNDLPLIGEYKIHSERRPQFLNWEMAVWRNMTSLTENLTTGLLPLSNLILARPIEVTAPDPIWCASWKGASAGRCHTARAVDWKNTIRESAQAQQSSLVNISLFEPWSSTGQQGRTRLGCYAYVVHVPGDLADITSALSKDEPTMLGGQWNDSICTLVASEQEQSMNPTITCACSTLAYPIAALVAPPPAVAEVSHDGHEDSCFPRSHSSDESTGSSNHQWRSIFNDGSYAILPILLTLGWGYNFVSGTAWFLQKEHARWMKGASTVLYVSVMTTFVSAMKLVYTVFTLTAFWTADARGDSVICAQLGLTAPWKNAAAWLFPAMQTVIFAFLVQLVSGLAVYWIEVVRRAAKCKSALLSIPPVCGGSPWAIYLSGNVALTVIMFSGTFIAVVLWDHVNASEAMVGFYYAQFLSWLVICACFGYARYAVTQMTSADGLNVLYRMSLRYGVITGLLALNLLLVATVTAVRETACAVFVCLMLVPGLLELYLVHEMRKQVHDGTRVRHNPLQRLRMAWQSWRALARSARMDGNSQSCDHDAERTGRNSARRGTDGSYDEEQHARDVLLAEQLLIATDDEDGDWALTLSIMAEGSPDVLDMHGAPGALGDHSSSFLAGTALVHDMEDDGYAAPTLPALAQAGLGAAREDDRDPLLPPRTPPRQPRRPDRAGSMPAPRPTIDEPQEDWEDILHRSSDILLGGSRATPAAGESPLGFRKNVQRSQPNPTTTDSTGAATEGRRRSGAVLLGGSLPQPEPERQTRETRASYESHTSDAFELGSSLRSPGPSSAEQDLSVRNSILDPGTQPRTVSRS